MPPSEGRAKSFEWFEQLPCSMIVCDKNYKILYMNDMAAEFTAEDGGKALVGRSLLDCHPAVARKRLKEVMASGRPNVYTVEKKGVKKMVFHGHWRKSGRVGGIVELVFVLPGSVPHRVRS